MMNGLMSPEKYNAFLSKGLVQPDDPLRAGASRHTYIMTLIAGLSKDDPAMVMAIGRLIDQLVGSIVVQHLEAAMKDPEKVPDVARLMRVITEQKILGKSNVDIQKIFGK